MIIIEETAESHSSHSPSLPSFCLSFVSLLFLCCFSFVSILFLFCFSFVSLLFLFCFSLFYLSFYIFLSASCFTIYYCPLVEVFFIIPVFIFLLFLLFCICVFLISSISFCFSLLKILNTHAKPPLSRLFLFLFSKSSHFGKQSNDLFVSKGKLITFNVSLSLLHFIWK